MRKAVFAVARCPSVCLSVTFVHSIQTAEDIVKLLCQPGSHIILVFRLDALALSVIATATWLAGWLGGWVAVCHSRYCIKTTRPIRKLFGPSGRPIIYYYYY